MAKKLPKKLYDTKNNLNQVEKQLNTVNEKIPELLKVIEELPNKQEEKRSIATGLQEKITKLREQIAIARDVASRIKVGVKFEPQTMLQLQNPPNIADLTTSTYVSGYFRTPKERGLIFYLGNPVGQKLRKHTVSYDI